MEEELTRRTHHLYLRADEFYSQKLQLKILMHWADYVRSQYRKKLDIYFNPKLNQKSSISSRTQSQSFEIQSRSRAGSLDQSRPKHRAPSDIIEGFGDYSSILHSDKSPVRLYSFCQEFTDELDKLIQDEENVIEYYYSKLIIRVMKTWLQYTRFRRNKKLHKSAAAKYRLVSLKKNCMRSWNLSYRRIQILNKILLQASTRHKQSAFVRFRKSAFLAPKMTKTHSSHQTSRGTPAYESVGSLYKSDYNSLLRSKINATPISHMDDTDLMIKIQMLERKLSTLNKELTTEQLMNNQLLIKKRDLLDSEELGDVTDTRVFGSVQCNIDS